MAKDFVLQLRYVGVFPEPGHREYRFRLEKANGEFRDVTLTIDNDLFGTNRLMFQEAPDLCYQKLLIALRDESNDAPVLGQSAVTATDIESYRDSHPAGRERKLKNRT
jgi:hypothetical protein